MVRRDFHKVVIGRAELLHLMDYQVADIPAKIDTGAYGSAVHADKISLSADGKTLSFRLLGGHPVCGGLARDITTNDFKKVRVANSFNQTEERYMVKLRVKLGPRVCTTIFTLADRSGKAYPVLVGRKLLNKRFVVDTAYSQVDRRALMQKFGIDFPVDEEAKK